MVSGKSLKQSREDRNRLSNDDVKYGALVPVAYIVVIDTGDLFILQGGVRLAR